MKTTVADFKNGKYLSMDGIETNWGLLVATIKEDIAGICKGIDEAINEGLDFYTNKEITDIDDLPDKLQAELYDEQYCCSGCGFITYPGEICDCGCDEDGDYPDDDENEEEDY